MLRLAFLASGGGTNLQAVLDAVETSLITHVSPVLLIVDRPCDAMIRVQESRVDLCRLDFRRYGERLSNAVNLVLNEYSIDIIALAGWLSILDESFIRVWEGRIINIHPSLLPRHGGKGMYGMRVHQAVIESGDKESGCTVHYVNEGVDEGEIIAQSKVPVHASDTAETLSQRVLLQEHQLYPRIIDEVASRLRGRW